jgi:hypothetical protein
MDQDHHVTLRFEGFLYQCYEHKNIIPAKTSNDI